MGCWMGRIVFLGPVLGGAMIVLAGCGLADVRSPLPEFMRAKAVEPPPPEPPPDVRQLLRDNLESVFVANSTPRQIEVAQPYRDPRGVAWTACVRAEVNSAMGRPLGPQTYRIMIAEGQIVDRRRVDADDNCVSEHYEAM